jgi:hypothetical protein
MGTQGEGLSIEQMTQGFMSLIDAKAQRNAPEIQNKK